jgi:hypothetical protein
VFDMHGRPCSARPPVFGTAARVRHSRSCSAQPLVFGVSLPLVLGIAARVRHIGIAARVRHIDMSLVFDICRSCSAQPLVTAFDSSFARVDNFCCS